MSVASLYRFIVDDVLKNVKAEFLNEGLDEQALHELQQMWETKLMQSGAISALGMAEGTEFASHTYSQYEMTGYHPNPYASDHSTSFPQLDLTHNSLYNAMNIPLYLNGTQTHTDTTSSRHHPTSTEIAANALRSLNNGSSTFDPHTLGKPQQYMPPPPSVTGWNDNGTPQVNINLGDHHRTTASNNASLRSILSDRIHDRIPQHDGAGDEPDAQLGKWEEAKKVDALIMKKYQESTKEDRTSKKKKTEIPQLDGLGDDNLPNKRRARGADSDDNDSETAADSSKDDEELDSDLDDDDDTEPDTEHLVLCQFEKVTRIKNKRKCNLKDGIMHLHGRDYVFHKATAEFDW